MRIAVMLVFAAGCGDMVFEPKGMEAPKDTSDVDADHAACSSPEEILSITDQSTGFVRCGDGSLDRPNVVTLNATRYESRITACDPKGVIKTYLGCTTNGDCTEQANGRCYLGLDDIGAGFCACTYLCSDDADCQGGTICLPPEVVRDDGIGWPVCIPATCASNEECRSDECGVAILPSTAAVPTARLVCRDSEDECRTASDCEGEENLCYPRKDWWACESWTNSD